jgi:hypothetical protein
MCASLGLGVLPLLPIQFAITLGLDASQALAAVPFVGAIHSSLPLRHVYDLEDELRECDHQRQNRDHRGYHSAIHHISPPDDRPAIGGQLPNDYQKASSARYRRHCRACIVRRSIERVAFLTCTKLRLDFPPLSSIRRRMDDDGPASPDPLELIAHLCLEAGRIMEDTSCELALVLPLDDSAIGARLKMARDAADDILALIAAAQAVYRRQLKQS